MPLQLNPNQEEVDHYGRHHHQQQQHSQAFFQPLECEPILQIGYQGQQDGMGAGPSVNNYMLGWLPYDTNSI